MNRASLRSLRLQESTGRSLAISLFLFPCVACAPVTPAETVPSGSAPAPTARVAAPAASAARITDAAPPAERRVEDLLSRMTLEEKIDYIGGDRGFYVRPVARLGIPEIKMSDGPSGCRNWGPSTAYASAIALAATFDRSLAERVGRSIGRDCRARGVHVLLAPGLNIQRSPLNGRNFEYLGEDPLLAGEIAAAYVRGVQGEGVLSTVKHFVANDQEWDRGHVSSEVDERTLREIYFPAFERVVREAHVGAAMTSYNLLNGTYCSHNSWLLHEVLEQEWGFSGIVMSDWQAAHDAAAAANGGLDLEMPAALNMNRDKLLPFIKDGTVALATIDEKVRRILRTIIAAGFLDTPQKRDDLPLDDPSSSSVALEEARRGVVLLRNEKALLPLDRAKVKRIAVIGPNATPAVVGGSGSAFVTPFHSVSLLDGMIRVGGGIEIDYHPGVRQATEAGLLGRPVFDPGLREDIFAGRELAGEPVARLAADRIDFQGHPGDSPAPGVGSENYSIRWTGTVTVAKPGKYRILTNSDDGIRAFIDGSKVLDDWHDHAQTMNRAVVDLKPGTHAVVVEYYQGTGGAAAQFGFGPDAAHGGLEGEAEVSTIARRADVVVVSVGYGQSADTNSVHTAFEAFWPPPWARQGGLVEAEDSDRPFELPAPQLETLRLAIAANPRTIVVINAGGGVDLRPFVEHAGALLWAWYPGQEGGQAVSEVLFGDVNPSGKLPVTLAKRYADYPSAASYNLNLENKTPYKEGIFVGYRGFDANRTEPAFPFGFGLSYTAFEYSELQATPRPDGSAKATLKVTNRGSRPGDEVAQVYVAPPRGAVPRPPKELKGFARVSLSPGETKEVAIDLEPSAFAYWDEAAKTWTVAAGTYEVLAGSSSADLRLRRPIDIGSRVLPP